MRKLIPLLILAPTYAYGFTTETSVNCSQDYFRYCSEFGVADDKAITQCLIKNILNISGTCAKALREEGLIPERKKPEIVLPPNLPPVKGEPPATLPPLTEKEARKTFVTKFDDGPPGEVVIKNKEPAHRVRKPAIIKTVTHVKKRKIYKNGKWKGLTLYVEWNDSGHREYGSELTMYGYEDRN